MPWVSRHLVKAEELEEFYMLVSAKRCLKKQSKATIAVGQFNINNLNGQRLFFLQQKSASHPLSWACPRVQANI